MIIKFIKKGLPYVSAIRVVHHRLFFTLILLAVGQAVNAMEEPRFLSVKGFALNLSEERVLKLAQDQGYKLAGKQQSSRYTRYAFRIPDNRLHQLGILVQKKTEGGLQLEQIKIHYPYNQTAAQVEKELNSIAEIYQQPLSEICREVRKDYYYCQASREVNSYTIKLSAKYFKDQVSYKIRSYYDKKKFPPPPQIVCLGCKPTPTTSTKPSEAEQNFKAAQQLEKTSPSDADHQKAAELYEKSAAKGDARAKYNLSQKYAKGEGVEKSPQKELDLLEQAAEAGMAEAQYNLAVKHAKGEGAQEDQERASELFEKASEKGDADAQLATAKRYLTGLGVEQNDAKAVDLLKKAADNGSLEAQYMLAKILEEGILAPNDTALAEKLMRLSAAGAYPLAVKELQATGRGIFPPNDIAKTSGSLNIRY